ncbi:sporulation protein [Brevibacillus borstelensis]|uniref:YhcN/YlaJ family sporulation lipoprotein n=1 Tax=Brevibacillus borstelensis TaxID=45462 RepID=UPI00148F58A7|nr:YhcN/YlaJ family sporulation lipoprotein [Brevibacillus borstelensis]MCC0562931.1 YhcN/YlaJ family sporulation lipoprotein [Brevibacillus borstelensis]MCM3470381.1 YhcN/YlaJ family sporulation lipoprotein [Brevibacillus borstelensis]MCM3557200.1 YhcN/YlaJ family sporulation lipoprotein [Brevibacillus borstelensis]MCM3590810.1 YhcN/YlaJ family sporulation lipoprotein [Brevibacillus borstelensis]NOU55627.1 sporulation protein [Brevibacillus borstelensis]
MEPLNKKTWLLQAVAGIALLTSACANNAAPDANRPNGTTVNQAAPRLFNADKAGVYDNAPGLPDNARTNFPYTNANRPAGIAGTTRGTVFGDTGYNGGINSYNAFTDNGMRPLNRAGTNNQSIYRTNQGAGTMATNTMPHMGYAQAHRADMQAAGVGGANGTGFGGGANNVFVDRDALARAVGNVTVSCPGVDRSTVLVTDEEVFVGLNTQGPDGRTAKDQARMNAMSVSPRYYKVYVTDNQQDIDEISRIASRTSNGPVTRAEDTRQIDALIKRMGGTVDGEEMRTKGSTMTTENNRTNKAKQGMGTSSR